MADEKMSDVAAPVDNGMDVEVRERLDGLHEKLQQAKTLHSLNASQAEILYKSIIAEEWDGEEFNKIKEQAICKLGELFADLRRVDDINKLLIQIRPFFSNIPKAKTAKIVRTLIDYVAKVPGAASIQRQLCTETITWCTQEKRTFLRHRIQTKLAQMLFEGKDYVGALALVSELLKEVKKLDDKPLLVEIHLIESRTYHQIRNLAKSKAALTSARTAANAIYCPPILQAQIDTQSGTLHAEEKDYKTAYSYFYEAFEAFNSQEDPRAVISLKHMLLCKIMTNQADDVPGLIDGKNSLKYAGPDLEAMREIAAAYKLRSLESLVSTQEKFKPQLAEDPVIRFHLQTLYDTLLEQNLARLVEPFSYVHIPHIASLIKLPVADVEATLSQMILDKKFNGILDQGAGALIAYQDAPENATYETVLQTIDHMGRVVDSLYTRASKLS